MRYLDIIADIIKTQISKMDQYSLIKLENFQNPELYYKLCKKLADELDCSDIRMVAKLSRERYQEWSKEKKYKSDLELMKSAGYVEEIGSLTKWRNDNFLTIKNERMVIILMGTEKVVDKGGLLDFYTISPETIERSVGENYSEFFHGLNSDVINNIYRNLFYYVEKDLYKLDQFAMANYDIDTEILVKSCILETLDEIWDFPNMPEINYRVLSDTSKRIALFNKAHKFNRRIGLDNLPSAKKIESLGNKIDKFYKENQFDIDNDFNNLFPGYQKYEEVKLDLIDYYSGINVDTIRKKLIKCDFVTIDRIIGLKIRDSKQETKNKDIKVYGNPINAMLFPLTKMVIDLSADERKTLKTGQVIIDEIKLANVSSEDESVDYDLIKKWQNIRRFIQGIDMIIEEAVRNNVSEEFEMQISSFDSDDQELNPFLKENAHSLITSDVLKVAALRDSVSKISFSMNLMDTDGEILKGDNFIWYIFDTEPWINAFDIIYKAEALKDNKIDEISYYLPIGISRGLESLAETSNNDEFYEVYQRFEIDYRSSMIDGTSMDSINTKAYCYGKSFVKLLRAVDEFGFLGIIKRDILRNYFLSFKELNDEMLKNIKTTSLEAKIHELSKAMTVISNEDDITKKGAQITMIPAYHPVMLEKIVQRYVFLSVGIDEIFKIGISKEDISSTLIEKKYEKIDQLATITSATAATINDMNRFEAVSKTFGYCSVFGLADANQNEVNINASYTKEDDELENVTGKIIATPVSNYISKTIRNYLSIYPYKQDGLRVLFFNPKNFSDIIAALKGLVEKYKKDKQTLRIELIVYTSDYRCRVYNYLKSWIENNIDEDDSINLIARIKYFDYKSSNLKKNAEESIQSGDITFMFEIMEKVELREEPFDGRNGIETMYPSTYLPIPKNNQKIRLLAISQLQFECENSYTQLAATIKNPHIEKKSYQIFTESKLFNQFVDIIQVLHEKSNWVVCLDENVDPSLIKFTGNEIIGYSTGEGYFGELNATISSSESILVDIERYLIKRMKKEFTSWKNDEIKIAANLCIDYAYELDGAEVLKAINPRDEAIKDYLAFYLSTKIEQQSIDHNKYYYRKLLSLDLYDQLFEDDETIGYLQTRPDFLLIEVAKKDNSLEGSSDLKVKVRIIECKMGGSSYMNTAINKAKEQVSVGNSRLRDIWVNHNGIKRRYWQNQLYKILTLQNSIKMNSEELDKYAKKVMHIFTGEYSIEFENCIYTFSLENENDFTENHFYKGIPIKQLNFGTSTTKNILLGREKESVYDFGDMEYNSFVAENLIGDFSKNSNIKELEEENNVGVRQQSIDNAMKDNIFEDQISASIENSFKDNEVSSIEVTETEVNKEYSRLIEHENMIDIFKAYNIICSDEEKKSIQQKLDRLAQELKQRKTKVIVQKYSFGPDIIRVELDLATGVNISQLKKFDDDMKYWLSINEKPFIYIKDGKIVMDIIRDNRQTIGLKNMLTEINKRDLLNDSSKKFYALLGSDILGNPLLIDFSDSNTPHLLVAGQTGSGKSVLLNSMLLSIMMFYSPSEVEMILVDPKFIELTLFTESPYTKEVLTEAEDAVTALENLVEEMNNRYRTFRAQKSKNISSYNAKVDSNKMKRILMVFDEYAALMEENKEIAKRLERAIKILSQKARAAGIHLIICTQSPRADIITTTIRNNLTARVGLRVADSVASNLILDTSGAETLLGKGDMLLKTASSSNFLRAKSPYVTEDEIEEFIEACKEVY